MLFKKIEMHGFKSFAEPITIEFSEGIIGIVGPNGSGKSNISDAIRWVLGEQSPKMLRGGKMEEVIFNGTDSRKSRGMAEVTLTIDNSDESLPIDYNEVAITRRMFRSGESEYRINGNQCRLRDIRELIMDTGIGVDGYSIIGQGKIADIISNKTESRREIFEEAAGIVAYRTKKDDAQRKLSSTKVNMDRVQDIIGEIEGRIDGLKEDSEKAKEYLELKDRNKKLEINIILKNIEGLESKHSFAEEDLRNIVYNLDRLKAEKDELDEEVIEVNQENERLEKVVGEAQDTLLEAIDQLNLVVNKGQVDRERLTFIDANTDRLEGEIRDLEERKERELSNVESFHENKKKIDSEAEEAKGDLREKTEIHNNMSEEMDLLMDDVERCKNKIFGLSTEINSSKAEISSMEHMSETLEKRKEILLGEKESGEGINRETLDSLNLSKKEQREIQEAVDSIREKLQQTRDNLASDREEEKILAQETEELKVSLGRLSARKKTIEEMESNYEGYNYAVKHVMKSGFRGIHGVVADLISVPQGMETAIETAMGASLQNIVCDNENSAKAAIRSLKENRAGRMTFLPVETIKGRNKPEAPVENERGFVDFAVDAVEYDSKYRNVMSYLLGRVIIADNMDNAIRISSKSRGALVVTLEGEIINDRGAITGGKYRNKTANILDRKAELTRLGSEIDSMEQKQITNSHRLEELRQYMERSAEDLTRLEEDIRQKERTLMMKNNEIQMAESALLDIKNSGDRADRELSNIRSEQANTSTIVERLKISIGEKEEEIKKIQAECESKLALYDEKKGSFDTLSEEITKSRMTVSACETRRAHADDLVARINSSIREIDHNVASKREEIQELVSERERLLGNVDVDELIAEHEKAKELAEVQLKEASDRKSEISSKLAEMNKDKEALTENIQKFQDQKYELDVRMAKNETQLETYKERLWDDFEVSYIQALEFKSEEFVLSRAVKDNRQFRNRMKELGEVNVGAIEEYATVSERYNFLTEERDDVQKALDDLNGIIDDMDKTIRIRFKDSFDKIVVNFENQFKRLFGGGHAELRLSDSANPLESTIDIIAQPPGKKLQNINLLSGGEKTLTAIALMFAVLEAKPTPFCILDEVEAALDDANIDRFIDCLRQFNGIQFTLVTHQKATMEHADILYGVTMPEKGVSKVLSLSLDDDLSQYNN
ncbi:MAG: chromosome segregation protein SMC [Bacillota bacterium]|nr:chromosome segregation protein SMC [Bacillota bacterium]